MAFANTPGIHIKSILGAYLPSGMVMDPALEKYWYPLSTLYGILLRELGYMHLQATKPDSVGEFAILISRKIARFICVFIFMKFRGEPSTGPHWGMSYSCLPHSFCYFHSEI